METSNGGRLRASNLIQVLVRCGRVLVDYSLVLRAYVASGAGHAVALLAMAFVVGGDGPNKTASYLPLLTVSASEDATPETHSLVQSSPDDFERLLEPVPSEADEAVGQAPHDGSVSAVAEQVSRSLAAPALFAGLMRGEGELGALKTESQPATEAEEKPTVSPRNLGRTASFYGVEAEGRTFVFVVDISGSMSGSRFRRARAELCESIEKLHPDQSFYVVLFNTGTTLMPSVGMAAADPANVESLGSWLKTISCGGETNPAPALVLALAMRPDAVYLLSDGKFDPGVAQTVAQLQVFQRIPVHTIGFASRKGEPMLRAISQVSGGTYRYVH